MLPLNAVLQALDDLHAIAEAARRLPTIEANLTKQFEVLTGQADAILALGDRILDLAERIEGLGERINQRGEALDARAGELLEHSDRLHNRVDEVLAESERV